MDTRGILLDRNMGKSCVCLIVAPILLERYSENISYAVDGFLTFVLISAFSSRMCLADLVAFYNGLQSP